MRIQSAFYGLITLALPTTVLSSCAGESSGRDCSADSRGCESGSVDQSSQALAVPGDDLVVFGDGRSSFDVVNSVGATNSETTSSASLFNSWASAPGVQRLTGDFNKDGFMDLALVGGPGWNTIPVAYSQGNGTFLINNIFVGAFGGWANTSGVKAVVGDFNHDGYSDIALTGVSGWTQIPVAFSLGTGAFTITQGGSGSFSSWAATPGAQVLVGDFNKDGFSDLALTGVSGWTQIPVAFAAGGGSWVVTQGGSGSFSSWAAMSGAQVRVGDFNHDGFSDIAVTGHPGWTQIPVAFASGGGSWTVTQGGAVNFAAWAGTPGVQVLAGDFNKDGFTDLALTGGPGWNTMPVAFSIGGGAWQVTNNFVGPFGSWASVSGVRAIAGDFNADGFTDVALTSGAGWSTIPVAFSAGFGTFNVTNNPVGSFAPRAATSGSTVVAGPVN